MFQVRIDEVDQHWAGSLAVGLTSVEPRAAAETAASIKDVSRMRCSSLLMAIV